MARLTILDRQKRSAIKFKAMTFNLRNAGSPDGENAWPMRVARVAEAVKTHAPHVLGVQEAYASMLDDLKPFLGSYERIGRGRDVSPDSESCAVLYDKEMLVLKDDSQFWLSKTPEVPVSQSWDSHFPRICTWGHFQFRDDPKSEFVFFNTHLDHRGVEARPEGALVIWKECRKFLDQDIPIILAGDFNSIPTSPTIQFLRGEMVRNGHRSELKDAYANLAGSPGRSSHGFAGGDSGEPIDYFFHSPSLTSSEVLIDRRKFAGGLPSDHYPVIASFGF